VVHNLSLVISVARKFHGSRVRLEDLVQEGNTASSRPSSISTRRRATASRLTRCGGSAPTSRAASRTPFAVRRTMPNGGLPPRDISLEETLAPTATATPRTSIGWPTKDRARMLSSCVPSRTEDVRNALGRVRKRMGELAWDILSDRLTQDDPRTLEDLASSGASRASASGRWRRARATSSAATSRSSTRRHKAEGADANDEGRTSHQGWRPSRFETVWHRRFLPPCRPG